MPKNTDGSVARWKKWWKVEMELHRLADTIDACRYLQYRCWLLSID